jgi:anti-anti-sigma factor
MNINLVIFAIQGDLTLSSGRDSLEVIKRNVKPQTHTILLDLDKIGFVDSSGLAMLIQLCKFTMGLGMGLALCAISEQMLQLLQLTSTESLFEIFDTRESFYQTWLEEFPAEATLKPLEDIPTILIHTD